MNIQSLLEKIQLFKKLVIESGFKRDVIGFRDSIAPQQNRQNLQLFRDIAGKIESFLNLIYESDLPESLEYVLPTNSVRPFPEADHLETFIELLSDTELDPNQYFTHLHEFLH